MNASATRSTSQHAERWNASRIFRTALAITLGVLAALVVTFTLFALVFGGTGRVVLEPEGDVVEVVDEVAELGSGQASDAAAAREPRLDAS
jgi:hypothetical protein